MDELKMVAERYASYFNETKKDRNWDNIPIVIAQFVKKFYNKYKHLNLNKDYHHFVPASGQDSIFKYFKYIKENYNVKTFLDVGCGMGNIVLLAEAAGFDADGLEYDPELCAVGSRLLGRKLIRGDALNFKFYKDYDFIYYYNFIKDPDKALLFSEKLRNEMKIGAIIMSLVESNSKHFDNDMRFTRLDGKYWTYLKGGKNV